MGVKVDRTYHLSCDAVTYCDYTGTFERPHGIPVVAALDEIRAGGWRVEVTEFDGWHCTCPIHAAGESG